MNMKLDATTIVAVKRNGKTAIAGDGEIRFAEKQTVSASVVVQKGGVQNRRS